MSAAVAVGSVCSTAVYVSPRASQHFADQLIKEEAAQGPCHVRENMCCGGCDAAPRKCLQMLVCR
jgi:hypothetical protein